jgi:hypothetical protein
MIYRDLWIESVNITAGRRSTLNINFLNGTTLNSLVRSNISLEIFNPTTVGDFMRTNIRDSSGPWELEILGDNRVRIGEDEYEVREPINISFG